VVGSFMIVASSCVNTTYMCSSVYIYENTELVILLHERYMIEFMNNNY